MFNVCGPSKFNWRNQHSLTVNLLMVHLDVEALRMSGNQDCQIDFEVKVEACRVTTNK